jgi:hypothetical protein
MAKLKKTSGGFQIVHGRTGKVLRTISGTGKESRNNAERIRKQIKRRNCGVKGDRCGVGSTRRSK